ncbi:MAG: hypothetical protein IJ173_01320 [Kiritimatiellae bacterium]|nr:hypothetical protein [Kiritimatiellia bacterium]
MKMKCPLTLKICHTLILSSAMLSGCISGNSDSGDANAEAEAENIVKTISSWLEPYKGKLGTLVKREGATTYLYGSFGTFQSVFNRFHLTFVIDAEDREVQCYGYLPTIVCENRRREMIEFIFRGEFEYGLSTASMVLEDDGSVRCQAWSPFESFALQPKETQWRLIGAVVDKLLSFSEGVAGVALGGDPAEAAGEIERKSFFERMDETSALERAADADTKIVLERCFDKDDEIEVSDSGDKWLGAFARRGWDARVGIINGHFEDVVRDVGGLYDVLPYSLVVRDGMVWNICNVPDECPNEAIGEVAEALMKINQSLRCATFGIDFNTGKMWSHYAVPVSVIPSWDERPHGNLYGAFIKTKAVGSVAKNSEALHSTMVKVLLRADDAEVSAMVSRESLSRQAEMVAAWLREHLNETKWEVATNRLGRICVFGVVRGLGSNADDCSLGFDLDDVGGELVCRGVLTKAVPEEKRTDVQKLLFHYGFRSRIGALSLDKDGRVRCIVSVPLLALRNDPDGTVRRLSINVLIPTLVLSDAVMRVCRDGQKPEEALDAAEFPRDVERALMGLDDDSCDATYEEEKVIESWFNAFGVRYERGIETELTVYYRNKDDVGQGLQECFVMYGAMVLSQCRLKIEIPEDRREAVTAFVLAYNATHSVVNIHMGYVSDPGDTIYFQYVMPASVLRAQKRNPVAEEHFRRLMDTAYSHALEEFAKIQEIVRGQQGLDTNGVNDGPACHSSTNR